MTVDQAFANALASLRKNYARNGLDEAEADPDPFKQFAIWFAEAQADEHTEQNAMIVATADASGMPSARTVLLKGLDDRGFIFYTNYESQKGRALTDNPRAALLFYWPELERQIRINGDVERLSREESERYFHSRPRGSQVGSAVSRQSSVVPDRAALEAAFKQFEQTHEETEIPLPAFWGGYRVLPFSFEFWQGRPNRLHDRLRYVKDVDGQWRIERLSP
jgi:pyridoxamine 5'-phosphate oxidase